MNSQRLVGLTAAAIAAGALLAGCGGGKEGSAGDIPTATVPGGKPPASNAPTGEESSAPGGSTGSAPKVSSPIDTAKFTGDVCATLSPSALSELGLGDGTPRQAATGPSCSWKFTAEDTNRVEIAAQEKNPNGLSDIYDQKDEFGYFEPQEIGGYPAVFASQTDQRASGSCGLYLGLNDQFAAFVSVRIGSGPDKSQPCPVVEKTAAAMIDTVKGG